MASTNKKPELRIVEPSPCQSWKAVAAPVVPAKDDIMRLFRLQALAKRPGGLQ